MTNNHYYLPWFQFICFFDGYNYKIAMLNIDSNLGTFIRTAVVLIMAWGIVFISEVIIQLKKLQKELAFLFSSELQQVYHGSVIIKRCN